MSPSDALDWIEREAFSATDSIPPEAYEMFQIVRAAVQAARLGDRPVGWINPHEVGLGGLWLPHGLAPTYSLRVYAQEPVATDGEGPEELGPKPAPGLAFDEQGVLRRVGAVNQEMTTERDAEEPVALESVHLQRDTLGMCTVSINGRIAIRDNGDVIDHFATLDWFSGTPAPRRELSDEEIDRIAFLADGLHEREWRRAFARAVVLAARGKG